jgi:hypothetical protein
VPASSLLSIHPQFFPAYAYTKLTLQSDKIDTEKPISAGFYRLEKGTPLVYTYTYHEMKIIVEGSFDISDETGNKVHAVAGVSNIRFNSIPIVQDPSKGWKIMTTLVDLVSLVGYPLTLRVSRTSSTSPRAQRSRSRPRTMGLGFSWDRGLRVARRGAEVANMNL